MKKALSAILACFVLLSSLSSAAFAYNETEDKTPIIMLQGFTGPNLAYYDENGEAHPVWHLSGDSITDAVLAHLGELIVGLLQTSMGDYELLSRVLGQEVQKLFEPLTMNPDGTSALDLVPYPQGAAATSSAALIEQGMESYIAEPLISDYFHGFVGEENLFSFTCDWRLGQVANAASLDEYIQQVKEITGSDKVNLYGLSHGGQLGATYLYYYGEKADVDKAVLNVPAVGGTKLLDDLLNDEPLNFTVEELVEFFQIGNRSETDYEWFLQNIVLDDLNAALKKTLIEYVWPGGRYYPTLWDLMSIEDYEKYKALYLDPVENAGIIAMSDEMHYNCMANMSEGLKRAQESGVSIALMCNTGRGLGTGSSHNSDYIISATECSGAYCTPIGVKFDKGYEQKRTTCHDETHYHVSPEMNIDASTAYLPENTWFINGQYHGQSFWDSYSKNFYTKFLFTDTIEDIYSDPAYPQFELASCPNDGVHAKFDVTATGYVTAEDSKLIVTNLSELYEISLTAICAKGADLKFDFDPTAKIPAGESVEIPFSGTLPEGDTELFSLTVNYLEYTDVVKIKKRTIEFTALSDSFAQSHLPFNPELLTEVEVEVEIPDTGSVNVAPVLFVLIPAAVIVAATKKKK